MKKFLIIFILGSILISCSDSFLDVTPTGQVYPENYYSSADDLEMAITGIYELCSNELLFYGNDLCFTIGGWEKASEFTDWLEVDVMNTISDNGEMGLFWSNSYNIINCANQLINNYEGADATDEEKQLNAGQAHFIRAYCYFGLIRKYNGIPFYLTEEDCTSDIGLTDFATVYTQIVADLKIAEEWLPENWDGDEKKDGVGWTNGAAKSLLAYVYLCMAGYPLNYGTEYYTLAASKAKEVIDGASTWGYKIMEDIADLYSADYNYENASCDEVVLAFHNDNDWGCPKCGCPGEYNGWDCYYAEIDFYESYPEGPRKDAVLWGDFPMEDGTTAHYTELATGHPYYIQYWDGKIDWDAPWDGFNWKNSRPQVALTHSNTLLVYAEAQAMSTSSPSSAAYDCINQIRNRAGLPDLTEGLSAEAFRDSIVRERVWEFCGNYFLIDPWYDILRLNRISEIPDKRNASENELNHTPTEDDYWAPYPVVDEVVNENLSND